MIIEPIPFRLKDGREAVLRCLTPDDAPALLEGFTKCTGETHFLYADPRDAAEMTLEGERGFIEEYNNSASAVLLGCFVDGRFAGSSDVTFKTSFKLRHRGSVGIAIQKEFWGLGIGTAMFRALIEIAENREGVTQLELDYVEGNARARALYEKMGFRICGVIPDAIRLADGTLLHEYMMIRKITR